MNMLGRALMERINMQKPNNPREKKINEIHAVPHVVEVAFALECAEAKEIFLCGDFNQWSPTALRMIRRRGNADGKSGLRCHQAATSINSSLTVNGLPILRRAKTWQIPSAPSIPLWRF